MLDPALTTMHDMTFRREGNRRAVNHEWVFTYVPRESEDFPRVNADFSFHKTKPSVRLWDAAGGALRGEHLAGRQAPPAARRCLQRAAWGEASWPAAPSRPA